MLERIVEQWDACRLCRLCDSRKAVVHGGPYTSGALGGDPLVLIICDAPGRREDAERAPIAGPPGELLRVEVLEPAGVRMAYIANVVACRTPGDRDPKAGEIDACAPRLAALAAALNPDALLLVGRYAERVGNTAPWAADLPKASIVHPASLLQQGHPCARTDKILRAQLAKVKRLVARVRPAAAAQAPRPAAPKACEHVDGPIGVWVADDGRADLPVEACGRCGVSRQSAPPAVRRKRPGGKRRCE